MSLEKCDCCVEKDKTIHEAREVIESLLRCRWTAGEMAKEWLKDNPSKKVPTHIVNQELRKMINSIKGCWE